MPFNSKVYRVFIASPSDVTEERRIIAQVINEWNANNSAQTKTVLLPVMWEMHATPELGDRPQAIINRQVLQNTDVLIGVIWSRLGTPTGLAPSGTVEEITEFVREGKHVLLYFSQAPLPHDADLQQVEAVRAFKTEWEQKGLVYTYRDMASLKDALDRHLTSMVWSRNGGLTEDPPQETAPSTPQPDATGNPPVFSYANTPAFFAARMAEAFPGLRGLKRYSGPEGVTRLSRLLKEPLQFEIPSGGTVNPIWWWHGHACSGITRFRVLDAEFGRCLIDDQELFLNSVTAYHSNDYQRHFLYLVIDPDRPSGVYPTTEDTIKRQIASFGYAYEEMGYFNGRYITRSEYDDGFAEVDGQIVAAHDAEIRTRYLSPYNLFICSVHTPLNQLQHDTDLDRFTGELLNGRASLEKFIEWMESLPQNPDLYQWKSLP